MRRAALYAFTALALAAAPAAAIPYFPPPTPIYEAPIDRALENVAAMEGLEPAQRENILGRLNLIAYARNDPNFAYLRERDELNLAGSIPCSEAHPGFRNAPDEPTPTFAEDARCAVFDFHMGPADEIPNEVTAEPSAGAMARLHAAEAHYARALELDRNNLRARLGYAYVLDRLGRMSDARRELRRLVDLGLPRIAEPQSDWETYVVLTETAAHMEHIAVSGSDKRRLKRLRAQLGATQPMMYVTPMVAPLSDAPFAELIDAASPVAFDFAGTGDTRAQGWLRENAGWLVSDPHHRGAIRSGFDLIGARTWAVFWSDGFEVLRALDDDQSGELAGAELDGLALWRDANANGVSDAGEVAPLSAHGIVGLATRAAESAPGLLTAPSGLRLENGNVRPLYDWTPGLQAPTS